MDEEYEAYDAACAHQEQLESQQQEERPLATVTHLKPYTHPRVESADMKQRRTFHERMLRLLDQEFAQLEESRRYHTRELQEINVRLFDLSRRVRA